MCRWVNLLASSGLTTHPQSEPAGMHWLNSPPAAAGGRTEEAHVPTTSSLGE
jgi:hypothetical protein